MVAIIRMLVEKALARDVSAAELPFKLQARPAGAGAHPNEIDRMSGTYQRDTINLRIANFLSSLPARGVG